MLKNRSVYSAIAFACVLASGQALAAQEAAPSLQDLAAASRFVVHSRVAKVEYRLSEAGPKGQAPVPFTIVTYDVLQPVLGTAPGASFSLRYVGGTDGRGHFLRASNVPVFQEGDEDILFVRDSGVQGCALAGCIEGRFRVLDGALYDGTGAPVSGIRSNRALAGGAAPEAFGKISYPTPSFDELMKNPEVREALRQQGLAMDSARRQYEAQAPARIEMAMFSGGRNGNDLSGHGGERADQGSTSPQAVARPMLASQFMATVGRLQFEAKVGAPAFQSVDANAAIAAPAAVVAAPAQAAPQGLVPRRSPADLAEERALPKDDPAITRNKAR